jgi:pimeloyl-ACP methyl ester carboxylesterase
VYAITRRGYGASSRPESGYDVARLGEDVRAVLDALRIEKPVLVGHSIVGQEMSYLAAEHRQTIAALIYLEAAYRYAYDVPGDFDKDFPNLPPPRTTPPGFATALHGAATPDPAFDRFDEAVTERQALAFERGVPGARVLRWPRASHYVFLTREPDVIKEVTDFIASLR